jgi:hypothetical protein
MPKYENAVVYKLCCKDASITDEYIGSTCNKYKRKQEHKSCWNNENSKAYNRLVYQFIRANGGFHNFDLIVIEEYPCESKVQLEMKEREYIERLRPTLNKQIPTRTSQEYRETHREEIREYRETHREEIKEYKKRYIDKNIEEIKEYQREYYEKHRESILEQNKQYQEEHRESLSEYHKQYRNENIEEIKEYNKQYINENKEKIREQRKQYYEENREYISAKQKQKNDCECGGRYINTGKNRHMKTQRHLKYLEDLNKL